MYARKIGTTEYIINGIEIDLSEIVDAAVLEEVSHITKKIHVDTTQSSTTDEDIDGKEVIFTKSKRSNFSRYAR